MIFLSDDFNLNKERCPFPDRLNPDEDMEYYYDYILSNQPAYYQFILPYGSQNYILYRIPKRDKQ